MKAVSIIRDRGQLTIPDNIRKKVSWANPMSPVTFVVTSPEEITIKPHKNQMDRSKLWEDMTRVRSIKGRGEAISTSEFLEVDRKSH